MWGRGCLLICVGEGWVGTAGVPTAGWGLREEWEGDEQEMFRLQDRTTLIPDVRNKTLTLIERENVTRSWGNFLVYFSHNNIPTWGVGVIYL
jgi:hypothetical protein